MSRKNISRNHRINYVCCPEASFEDQKYDEHYNHCFVVYHLRKKIKCSIQRNADGKIIPKPISWLSTTMTCGEECKKNYAKTMINIWTVCQSPFDVEGAKRVPLVAQVGKGLETKVWLSLGERESNIFDSLYSGKFTT